MSHSDDQLKAAFQALDADGSGAIDRKEIKKLLVEKLHINDADADKMSADVMKDDPNGDGKITMDEFMTVMKK